MTSNTNTNTLLLDTLFLKNYTDDDTQNFINNILKIVLAKILQQATANSRVAHRTRINIFDLIKVFQNLNITPVELFQYLKWIRGSPRQRAQHGLLKQKQQQIQKDTEMEYSQACQVKLSFGTGLDPKRPGTDFFPPLPSSFTYSFTPVINQSINQIIIRSVLINYAYFIVIRKSGR